MTDRATKFSQVVSTHRLKTFLLVIGPLFTLTLLALGLFWNYSAPRTAVSLEWNGQDWSVVADGAGLRTGDVVSVRSQSQDSTYFSELKQHNPVWFEHGLGWLETSAEELTIKVTQEPSHEDGEQLADVQAIIEFYSR